MAAKPATFLIRQLFTLAMFAAAAISWGEVAASQGWGGILQANLGVGQPDLELQANLPRPEPQDPLTASETIGLGLLLILAVGVFIASLWSSFRERESSSLLHLAHGPTATNLFLGMRFRPIGPDAPEQGEDLVGHLRVLELSEAVFISPVGLSKGANVRLYLESLPGFPATDLPVDAHVVRCKLIDAEPACFVIVVRFQNLGAEASLPLGQYLNTLNRRSNVLTHA